MPIRALIFDFDGTILDTETPEYHSWNAVYGEHGAELALSEWGRGIGTHGAFDPIEHLGSLTGRELDRDALTADVRARMMALVERAEPLPGVRAVIDDAHAAGLRVALASSSDRAWVTGWLERLGLLDRFECLATRHDVERVKPDPALYLRAAECLGVPPADCVAVEDSPNGMRAAINAGMRVVAVPNPVTAGLERPGGVLVLERLSDLTLRELLERIETPGDEPARGAS
jgi:HAD superfamily hydrolase (TIGR01509 family)